MLTSLRNGAKLLSATDTGGNGIAVLAKTDGAMPFVTWMADREGNCYWGHYFSEEKEARADYVKRANLGE